MSKYCLIGKHLPHSFSQIIHQSLGLDYILNEIPDEEGVAAFVKDNNFAGYNVTIPYKQTVMPHLDGLDASAIAANAVNTVIRHSGKSIGFNTDTAGMQAGLRGINANLKGEVVMILGSGGTASMAKALAQSQDAKQIITVSRNGEVDYGNYSAHKHTTVLINCTPVGMYPNNDGSPVDLSQLPRLHYVMDAVYNPLTTRLVAQARQLGIAATGGLTMLVAQAIIAQNLFLGYQKYDIEAQTKQTTAQILKQQSNIALVGMPSCGKSQVGASLAKLCGKGFVDTDGLIQSALGQSIPQIFAAVGEAGFRQAEKAVAADCLRGFGRVIATGGGIVLDADNRKELKQNSVVFWLVRDIDKLVCEGRPLSKDKNTLEAMAKIRYPLYNEVQDYIIDCNGSIDGCAKEIKEKYDAHFSN